MSLTRHIFLPKAFITTSAFGNVIKEAMILIINDDMNAFPTKIFEAVFESMTESKQKHWFAREVVFFPSVGNHNSIIIQVNQASTQRSLTSTWLRAGSIQICRFSWNQNYFLLDAGLLYVKFCHNKLQVCFIPTEMKPCFAEPTSYMTGGFDFLSFVEKRIPKIEPPIHIEAVIF